MNECVTDYRSDAWDIVIGELNPVKTSSQFKETFPQEVPNNVLVLKTRNLRQADLFASKKAVFGLSCSGSQTYK